MTDDASLVEAFAYCEALVRDHDPDRYWAAFFAPADRRPHLFALFAFNQEIARVRESISAPLPGEIRFQWWRDLLDAHAGAAASRDEAQPPVARALIATIARFRLPVQAFQDLIDARVFDLYDDAMPSVADLEGYCGETSSVLFRLASLVLTDGREPGGADAVGHGGVAFAITGLLRALPWHLRRGQVFVPADIASRHGLDREGMLAPSADDAALRHALADMRALARDHLARALARISDISPDARAAALPLATVPAYLKQMEKRDYSPRRTIVEVPQWRRLWALWRASHRWRNL
ncbi:phytoene/squalene synthase family protein [Pseudochelatococcus sp. B33]